MIILSDTVERIELLIWILISRVMMMKVWTVLRLSPIIKMAYDNDMVWLVAAAVAVCVCVCVTLCAGSGVVRTDPLRFLAGCLTRRLNQALSVLSLSLGFFWCMCVVLLLGTLFRLCYFYVICVFCRLVVLVRLSVPVQVIDWKDSSPKWPIRPMCWWGR